MSSHPKIVLILAYSQLHMDPRVYRQILWLKDSCKVIAAGFASPNIDGVEFIELTYIPKPTPLRFFYYFFRLYQQFYWSSYLNHQAFNKLCAIQPTVIVSNDIETLPLALKLKMSASKKRTRVVYDAHEYAPREYEHSLRWRLLNQPYVQYLCKTYMHQADVMMTVSPGLSEAYQNNFRVSPHILTNAPFKENLSPGPVNPQKIKLIHHGWAHRSRLTKVMVEMMQYTDSRFELYLMLMSSNDPIYYQEIREMAEAYPQIHFKPPVPMPNIVKEINQYDIGLFLLPPTTLSYRFALPNKLFEFIQARLAVAIGPSPDMARLVNQYHCGVIAEDFTAEAMAKAINKLDTFTIETFKQNTDQAAKIENAETNGQRFRKMVLEI